MQLGVYSTEKCYFCGSKIEKHNSTKTYSCPNEECGHKHSYGYYNSMNMLYFIIEQYGFYFHKDGRFWVEDMDHPEMLMVVNVTVDRFPEITLDNYQTIVERFKKLDAFR